MVPVIGTMSSLIADVVTTTAINRIQIHNVSFSFQSIYNSLLSDRETEDYEHAKATEVKERQYQSRLVQGNCNQ
jgi:hypothetical protein